MKYLLSYNKRIILPALLLATLAFITGCGYYHKEKMRAEQWILAETGTHKKPYSMDQNREMPYHSYNPQDYVLSSGWALAIPGKQAYDLYISPYAPNKYFRSRRAPWSEVVCPYSGRPLILGKRGVVAEKQIPTENAD
jgi:uncharacterized membrane protein